MSNINNTKEVDNYLNTQQLRPLVEEDKIHSETVSDEKKAEMRLQQALSTPANETNVIGVSALPLKKDVGPEYSGEIQTQKKVADKVPKIGIDKLSEEEKKANKLNYSSDKKFNVVRYRTKEKHRYGSKEYKQNDSIEIIPVISGGAYINPDECYMTFDFITGQDANFGEGSAVNVFKRVYIKTNDGKILDDHLGVNIRNVIKDYWYNTVDYVDTLGELKGYNAGNLQGSTLSVLVHLSDLFEIFGSGYLLPPELINNCRLVFELEDAYKVLQNNDIGVQVGDDAEYKIDNVSVVYDFCYLNQDVVNLLHEQNISFEYNTYETELKTDNKFLIEKEKKKMTGVIVIRRDNTGDKTDIYDLDYFFDGVITDRNYYFSSDNIKTYELNDQENYLNNHNYFKNERTKNNITFDTGNIDHYFQCWDLTNNFNKEGREINEENLIEYARATNEDYLYYVYCEYKKKITIMTIDPLDASKLIMPKIKIEQ